MKSRKQRNGKGSGRPDRPSQVRERSQYPAGHIANLSDHDRAHNSVKVATAVIQSGGIMSHWSDVTETEETHVIPRTSLTEQQHLGLFGQELELEPVRCKQINHLHWIKGDAAPFPAMYHYMVETTDNRLVWKSDRTLLTQSKQLGTRLTTLKREGAVISGAIRVKTLVTDYTNTPASDMIDVTHMALDVDLRPKPKEKAKGFKTFEEAKAYYAAKGK